MSVKLIHRNTTAVLAAVALAAISAGNAFAFQITPISQDFEPSGRGASQSFQVSNDRDEPVTVTVGITTREMDDLGVEVMNPTQEFTVFPTEVVVPPKGTQIVRTKWVGDAAPKSELAYRIIAEETPLKTRRDTPGASIFMTVRYVGAVYVVPHGIHADVKVVSAHAVDGPDGKAKLEVTLENTGTGHAILSNPSLKVTVGGVTKQLNTPAMLGNMPGENMLAQHQRKFVMAWPEGLPKGTVQADLSFTADR
jgi:fimbrial chaperone protein